MAKKQQKDEPKAERPIQETTSNDGKFSNYERITADNPWDGDLIVQHRGKPEK